MGIPTPENLPYWVVAAMAVAVIALYRHFHAQHHESIMMYQRERDEMTRRLNEWAETFLNTFASNSEKHDAFIRDVMLDISKSLASTAEAVRANSAIMKECQIEMVKFRSWRKSSSEAATPGDVERALEAHERKTRSGTAVIVGGVARV